MTLVGGFASTVFIPLTHLLIEAYGWRGSLLVLAALLNLAICAASARGDDSEGRRTSPQGTGAPTFLRERSEPAPGPRASRRSGVSWRCRCARGSSRPACPSISSRSSSSVASPSIRRSPPMRSSVRRRLPRASHRFRRAGHEPAGDRSRHDGVEHPGLRAPAFHPRRILAADRLCGPLRRVQRDADHRAGRCCRRNCSAARITARSRA